MKKRNIFLTLGLSLALVFGVGMGLSAKSEVSEARAETAGSGSELFVNASFWGDAVTQMYFMGGTHDKTWVDGTSLGNKVYKFSVPEGISSFIIIRNSKSSHSWDDVWNQTQDIPFNSSVNYYTITSWTGDNGKCGYSTGFVKHFKSGDKVYADAENNFWYSDSAKSYFYAAFDDAGTNSWHEMTRVGFSNVCKYTFSSDVYCQIAILIRGSAGDWDHKWNQTPDIVYNNGNKSSNAFKLGADNEGTTAVTGMEVFSDDYLVNSFAYYFLDATKNYCSAEITNTSQIAGVLTSLSSEGTAVKSTFASATISHSQGGHATNADNALSRYWNMTHESDHGKGSTYSDFLDLGQTFMARSRGVSATIFGENGSEMTIAIVVIALVSVSAVAGVYFIRKRKHN